MASNFLVENLDGITTIRLQRRLNLADFLRLLDEIAALGVSQRRLWNATNNFNFSADEIRQIAVHARSVMPQSSRVAFVAADDLTFGQVRMFEAFRHAEGFRTKAFRDEPAARDWLLSESN